MASHDWHPDPEQMALAPPISGNEINGLGETQPRAPRHVYWALNPPDIAHGDMQMWFYKKNDHPALNDGRAARKAEEAVPLLPLAEVQVSATAEDWSARLKARARDLGAADVGITRIDPAWVFEGHTLPWRYGVVMAIDMDYDAIKHAPRIEAGVEVVRQYTRGMQTSKALAGWLRQQGHDAEPEHGPFAGPMTMIPAALAAGLGELGKHGSIINPGLGANFRLAAVLTNLELIPDTPVEFGAEGFCAACRICENACPPQAIAPDKQTVRGVEKWYVDFDRCLPFFNETAGCAICLAVCPFSRPGIGDNLVAKLARKAALKEARAAETP